VANYRHKIESADNVVKASSFAKESGQGTTKHSLHVESVEPGLAAPGDLSYALEATALRHLAPRASQGTYSDVLSALRIDSLLEFSEFLLGTVCILLWSISRFDIRDFGGEIIFLVCRKAESAQTASRNAL
jgi:hypothetical protein